jgi:quinone-modifying oxidoreductase subunit QmoB
VITHEVAITDVARVPELIDAYAAKIVEIGPSPMKAFA